MKKPAIAFTLLALAAMIVIGSVWSRARRAEATDPATPAEGSPDLPIAGTTPPPTLSPGDDREAILQEIRDIAAEYERLVERELQARNLIEATAPVVGEPGFRLVDLSDSPLSLAWDEALTRIDELNRLYEDRFGAEFEPPHYATPDPPPTSDGEIQALIDQAAADYLAWLEEDQRTGWSVEVFNPDELEYRRVPVGDSYVQERARWAAVLEFRVMLLAPPLAERLPDLLGIQSIVPGEVVLADVGALLPFYTDREIHEYRAGDWRVYVDPAAHRIVLMDKPLELGLTHRDDDPGAAGDALVEGLLEPLALDYIELLAPGVDVVPLTAVRDQKGDNFFFRWEDQSRPLLPDGRSYPFIQVALDADGELLNYYDTLGF